MGKEHGLPIIGENGVPRMGVNGVHNYFDWKAQSTKVGKPSMGARSAYNGEHRVSMMGGAWSTKGGERAKSTLPDGRARTT